MTPAAHFVKAAQGLERPNEHAPRVLIAGLCHDVKTFMHAVDEVDVRAARGAENNFRTFCLTPRRMRGSVIGSKIGLGFDDHTGSGGMNKHRSDKISGNVYRRAAEERQAHGIRGAEQLGKRSKRLRHVTTMIAVLRSLPDLRVNSPHALSAAIQAA